MQLWIANRGERIRWRKRWLAEQINSRKERKGWSYGLLTERKG
jgi:hypothetical protein